MLQKLIWSTKPNSDSSYKQMQTEAANYRRNHSLCSLHRRCSRQHPLNSNEDGIYLSRCLGPDIFQWKQSFLLPYYTMDSISRPSGLQGLQHFLQTPVVLFGIAFNAVEILQNLLSSLLALALLIGVSGFVVYAFWFTHRVAFISARNLISLSFSLLFWKPVEYAVLLTLGAYWSQPLLSTTSSFQALESWWRAFICLFIFKFFKVIIHIFAYSMYRADQPIANPTCVPGDVTVIIPTVGDFDAEFIECIETILANNPFELIISTVGVAKHAQANQVIRDFGDARIRAVAIEQPNKRLQVCAAINTVETKLIALADDHVFWPTTFLTHAIASFEDPSVGHVGTVKRVRRNYNGTFAENFLNFVATIYLERHNFECTASNAIDGGVFVISGRTAFLRSSIVQDPIFTRAFLSETWLYGTIGPLNVDDDNFITRFMVTNGFKIRFQNDPRCLMETSLGTTGGYAKFSGQLLRWARTTVRSNTTTLITDRTVYQSQPWSVYAVYFSALINFAVFYDAALFGTLFMSSYGSSCNFWFLAGILLLSKLIKPFPHYWRTPRDLKLLPFQLMFGYYHTIVKLRALLTCHNDVWLGRNLKAAAPAVVRPSVSPTSSSCSSGSSRPRSSQLALSSDPHTSSSGSSHSSKAHNFDGTHRLRGQTRNDLNRTLNDMLNGNTHNPPVMPETSFTRNASGIQTHGLNPKHSSGSSHSRESKGGSSSSQPQRRTPAASISPKAGPVTTTVSEQSAVKTYVSGGPIVFEAPYSVPVVSPSKIQAPAVRLAVALAPIPNTVVPGIKKQCVQILKSKSQCKKLVTLRIPAVPNDIYCHLHRS